MKNKFILIAVALATLVFSCKEEPEITTKSKVVNVSNSKTTWLYYSFEKDALVSISDAANDLTWDLAVQYESFQTNGGTSGEGMGAVLDMGKVAFESVTFSSIKDSLNKFVADDSLSVYDISSMPPILIKASRCIPMEAMFKSPTGPGTRTYEPNLHVYIIKTANGKHVKFIGESFFNDEAIEGYINFKWAYLD